MLSFHQNTRQLYELWRFSSGWKVADIDDPERLAKAIKTYRTSPCVWAGGERAKKNFIAANWVALDFDDGVQQLDQAIEAFREYTHVIGTSRNHQREKKGNPPCDRFHVYFKLPITVNNAMDWEACVRYWIRFYQADRAAADAARMFSPCREIVSVVQGKDVPMRQIVKSTYAQRVTTTPDSGIPRWVSQLLSFGPSPGISRNLTCFKVAVHLMKAGYSEMETLSTIMQSAIPIDGSVEAEVQKTVESARKEIGQ